MLLRAALARFIVLVHADVTNSWNKLEYTSLIPVHVSHGNLHDALEAHQFLNDSGKEVNAVYFVPFTVGM